MSLIHNAGKGNKEVVLALIKDMTVFTEFVHKQLNEMKNETDRLGESWNDPQYKQFAEFIYQLSDSLKKDLDIFLEARDLLQEKVKIYDK